MTHEGTPGRREADPERDKELARWLFQVTGREDLDGAQVPVELKDGTKTTVAGETFFTLCGEHVRAGVELLKHLGPEHPLYDVRVAAFGQAIAEWAPPPPQQPMTGQH